MYLTRPVTDHILGRNIELHPVSFSLVLNSLPEGKPAFLKDVFKYTAMENFITSYFTMQKYLR